MKKVFALLYFCSNEYGKTVSKRLRHNSKHDI